MSTPSVPSPNPKPATGSKPDRAAVKGDDVASVPNTTTGTGTEAAAPAFDLSNRKLGDFQLVRRIGRGGMAEVYLAEQLSLKRQVAVKVLRPEYVQDASYLKRFQHEAKAAAGLNHPNIVQVYTIGSEDGIQFIAQEYVQGRNLKEFLTKKGPLETGIVLQIMRQVASALQVAATAGIVHRDIKPENVLLTRKGEAKVADFGLAQLTQQGEKVQLTQIGVTMGTPLYMSPEQIQGKPLDPRSDIYSFGVMVYHMLTGRPPFEGESALAVAVQHLNKSPLSIEELRPDLPPRLAKLIRQMMSKNPADRPQSAQEIVNEVRALQKGSAGTVEVVEKASRTVARTTPGMQRTARRALVRTATMFGLAALAIGGASAGAGWAMRIGDPFLVPVKATTQVPKQDSAQAQYYLALTRGYDEAAWKAVLTYWPEATLEGQRANEQLAMIYLKTDRLNEAREIYDNFIRYGDRDPALRATGLAGMAVVTSLQHDPAQAQQYFKQYEATRKGTAPELGRLLEDAMRRNARGG